MHQAVFVSAYACSGTKVKLEAEQIADLHCSTINQSINK